jgi:hypothetical protein
MNETTPHTHHAGAPHGDGKLTKLFLPKMNFFLIFVIFLMTDTADHET